MEAFDSITPEKWQSCINHVIKEENDFIENDAFLDELDESNDDDDDDAWEDVATEAQESKNSDHFSQF